MPLDNVTHNWTKPNKKPAFRRVSWMSPDYTKLVVGGRMAIEQTAKSLVLQRSVFL